MLVVAGADVLGEESVVVVEGLGGVLTDIEEKDRKKGLKGGFLGEGEGCLLFGDEGVGLEDLLAGGLSFDPVVEGDLSGGVFVQMI